MRLNSVTFEVLKNALCSMCDEGSEIIARLAYAPTISEGHDHSCAILDAKDGWSATAIATRRRISGRSSPPWR